MIVSTGIVADEPDEEVFFHAATSQGHVANMASSVSSLAETGSNLAGANPYDFSCYMDQVRAVLSCAFLDISVPVFVDVQIGRR